MVVEEEVEEWVGEEEEKERQQQRLLHKLGTLLQQQEQGQVEIELVERIRCESRARMAEEGAKWGPKAAAVTVALSPRQMQ